MRRRNVVVTTGADRKGVFFGELLSVDIEKETAELKDAQLCVYWSAETRGVLGLASIGPQKGSRVTPIVPNITLNGVTAIMDTTKEAAEKWKAMPWS